MKSFKNMTIRSCFISFAAGFLVAAMCIYGSLIIEKTKFSEDDAVLYAYDRLQHLSMQKDIPLEDFIGPELREFDMVKGKGFWEVVYRTEERPTWIYRLIISKKGTIKLWGFGKTPQTQLLEYFGASH